MDGPSPPAPPDMAVFHGAATTETAASGGLSPKPLWATAIEDEFMRGSRSLETSEKKDEDLDHQDNRGSLFGATSKTGPTGNVDADEADGDRSGSEDELCCRICRQGEEAGKLNCPCRCSGSIKWIHESCLRVWLKQQDRRPVCELCGYAFTFVPVYAQHAPQRLTVADWAGALGSSAMALSGRVLRILYATTLWGVALPLLTVCSARAIFGGRSRLPPGVIRHVLPFTLHVFLGECLSLAGIALIYFVSVIRGLLTHMAASIDPDGSERGGSQTTSSQISRAVEVGSQDVSHEAVGSAAAFETTRSSSLLQQPVSEEAAARLLEAGSHQGHEASAEGAASEVANRAANDAAAGSNTAGRQDAAGEVVDEISGEAASPFPQTEREGMAESLAGEEASRLPGTEVDEASQQVTLSRPEILTAAPPQSQEQLVPRLALLPTPGGVREQGAETLPEEEEEEVADAEEDLWNIMGLQGNPLRALICMVTFLCANVLGISIFLAMPFFLGRCTLNLALRIVVAAAAPNSLTMRAMASGDVPRQESSPGFTDWLWRMSSSSSHESLSIRHPDIDTFEGDSQGAVQSIARSALGFMISSTSSIEENSTVAADVDAPASDGDSEKRSVQQLLPPGHSPLLDLSTLTIGYVVFAVLLLVFVPAALLIIAALDRRSRAPEVVRAAAKAALMQAQRVAINAWCKLQTLAIITLLLVLVPCYIGHLMLCLLCGPVLHMSQHMRVVLANANMPLTLVMQLFVGYMHLWGVSFLEGCVADVCSPALLRRASANFFIGALCSHRRLFGSSITHGVGVGDLLLPVAHTTALKLMLVHVAFHTLLAGMLWYLPAWLLDTLLGEALFPVHLLDRAAVSTTSAVTVGGMAASPSPSYAGWSQVGGSSLTDSTGGRSLGSAGAQGGQPFFVIEMLQLYILVLQCLRVLDASPGLARLTTCGLRAAFRRLGLQHWLAPPLVDRQYLALPTLSLHAPSLAAADLPRGPLVSPSAGIASYGLPSMAPLVAEAVAEISEVGARQRLNAWQPLQRSLRWTSRSLRFVRLGPGLVWPLLELIAPLIAVSGLLLLVAWAIVALVLALPLAVGRVMVRYLATQSANRLSDFLPLSLGVVVLSVATLAMVKFGEALPAIMTRAAAVQQRRIFYLLICASSFAAMLGATLVLIPLGLGTLLLRLVLPLKAHSVFQVPIVFLVMDCWSLGLVISKVIWRLAHTDVFLHGLHLEFSAVWIDVQGSFTNLFFDLRAHRRAWRGLILPILETIVLHLVLPRTAAFTALRCCIPEHKEFLRAAVLMYTYHAVLAVRILFAAVPATRHWVSGMRQRIFDSKYLVSTELQNYHPQVGS